MRTTAAWIAEDEDAPEQTGRQPLLPLPNLENRQDEMRTRATRTNISGAEQRGKEEKMPDDRHTCATNRGHHEAAEDRSSQTPTGNPDHAPSQCEIAIDRTERDAETSASI